MSRSVSLEAWRTPATAPATLPAATIYGPTACSTPSSHSDHNRCAAHRRTRMRTLVAMALLTTASASAYAQQARDFGTPQAARFMLERVIGAMRTDQAGATR